MMMISETCGAVVINHIEQFLVFLKSHELEIIFILGSLKTLFHYLFRHPTPEGQDLACTLLVLLATTLVLAAATTYPPRWATQMAAECEAPTTKVARSAPSPRISVAASERP